MLLCYDLTEVNAWYQKKCILASQCPFKGSGYFVFVLLFYVPSIVWWSLFCYAVISVLSNFAIFLTRKRELIALL